MIVLSLTWQWRSGPALAGGAAGCSHPADLLTASTAVLLDLHGDGLTNEQKRELVRAHQALYCR